MKPTLLFSFLLCCTFYSCEPASFVKLVKDKKKGTNTYLIITTKYAKSAQKRKHQQFNLEFVKTNVNPGKVDIFITTYLDPNDSDLSNEVNFMYGSQKLKYEMKNHKPTNYNKNNRLVETFTAYETKKLSVIGTETISANTMHINKSTIQDESYIVNEPEANVVYERVPSQKTRYTDVNSNYTVILSRITLDQAQLKDIVNTKTFKIRMYNTEQDFWDLKFNHYNTKDLKNFINEVVTPFNTIVN